MGTRRNRHRIWDQFRMRNHKKWNAIKTHKRKKIHNRVHKMIFFSFLFSRCNPCHENEKERATARRKSSDQKWASPISRVCKNSAKNHHNDVPYLSHMSEHQRMYVEWNSNSTPTYALYAVEGRNSTSIQIFPFLSFIQFSKAIVIWRDFKLFTVTCEKRVWTVTKRKKKKFFHNNLTSLKTFIVWCKKNLKK